MASYKWRQIRTDKVPSTSGWKTSYMQSNGILCWYIMRDSWGLSLNQSCGVLGNMQAEGYLNPAQWQIGSNYDASAGYGMFQFTPSTKYTNTVTSAVLGNAKKNGKAQLQWVLDNPGQWSSGHSMDGLKALSNIGKDVVQQIKENRPYTGIKDFMNKCPLTKTAMINLIKGGAFDELERPDRKSVV